MTEKRETRERPGYLASLASREHREISDLKAHSDLKVTVVLMVLMESPENWVRREMMVTLLMDVRETRETRETKETTVSKVPTDKMDSQSRENRDSAVSQDQLD